MGSISSKQCVDNKEFVEWVLCNNHCRKDLIVEFESLFIGGYIDGNLNLFNKNSKIGMLALQNLKSLTLTGEPLNDMQILLENMMLSQNLDSISIDLTTTNSDSIISSKLMESIKNILPKCNSSSLTFNFEMDEMKESVFLNCFQSNFLEWISDLQSLNKLVIIWNNYAIEDDIKRREYAFEMLHHAENMVNDYI